MCCFQRIEEIKKSIQPILTKPSDVKKKRVMKKTLPKHQLEYEEAHKRLQQKKPSNGVKHSNGRKLYSQDSMDYLEIEMNLGIE